MKTGQFRVWGIREEDIAGHHVVAVAWNDEIRIAVDQSAELAMKGRARAWVSTLAFHLDVEPVDGEDDVWDVMVEFYD